MKKISKTLSIILAILMVMSIIPITASAETKSGTCGENATWTYDSSTYTLTISGTGEMYDYFWNSPWENFKNGIKTIIISDGITVVTSEAFCDCIQLTSVTLPDSLKSIERSAFANSKKLTNINIPESVTFIGDSAFRRCPLNGEITIHDGITSVGEFAFSECDGITSVIISSTATYLDGWVFSYCSNLENVTFPDDLTRIPYHAFSRCTSLKNISIPDSIKEIGYCAFYKSGYYNDELNWEDGVLYLDDCLIDADSSVISGTYEIKDGTRLIADHAFSYSDDLVSIIISETVSTIGNLVFAGCDALSKIIVDDNNQYFSNDEYGVLFNKDKTTLIKYPLGSAQTSYTIPDGTTTILDYALEYTLNLESIIIPESVIVLGKYVFRNNNDGFVLYYKGTQAQWDELLANNSETSEYLKNYTVNCIDNTIYPSGACGDNLIWTFNAHTSTLTISGTGPMYDYEYDSMSGFINQPWCDLTMKIKHIVIEDGVTKIGDYAFYDCYKVKNVEIGDSLSSYDISTFLHCGEIESLTVDTDNLYFSSEEDVLFNKDKTTLIFYPNGNTRESYTIPDGVTTIGKYSFNNCGETLKNVTIPKSVTLIEKYAFNENGLFETLCVYYSGNRTEWEKVSVYEDAFDVFNVLIYYLEEEHSHNYEAVVTTPTCTEQGCTTYTCECGDSYVDDYVDSTGHTEETIPAVAPTCTETGLTEGTICSVCGETLTEQKELLANGHTPANAVEENYIAPTCTENGSKEVVVYCSVCDGEISRETETLEATGHADNDGDGYCDADNELLDPTVECDHNCHKDGISGFFWKIINFFNKLFKTNPYCECGVAHY